MEEERCTEGPLQGEDCSVYSHHHHPIGRVPPQLRRTANEVGVCESTAGRTQRSMSLDPLARLKFKSSSRERVVSGLRCFYAESAAVAEGQCAKWVLEAGGEGTVFVLSVTLLVFLALRRGNYYGFCNTKTYKYRCAVPPRHALRAAQSLIEHGRQRSGRDVLCQRLRRNSEPST